MTWSGQSQASAVRLGGGGLCLLVAGLLTGLPAAADWRVEAASEPARVPVGQTCQYTVRVVVERPAAAPARVEVAPPQLARGLVATAARFESSRWVAGNWEYTCSWTLTADTPGRVGIPAGRVELPGPGGQVEWRLTPPVTVRIEPERGAAATAGGRSLFPIWLLGGIGLTIVGSALSAVWWLRQDEDDEPPVAAPPADSPEGRALVAVRAAGQVLAVGQIEAGYAALAHSLYTYVAQRGGRDAEGLTSREAIELLAAEPAPAALQAAVAATLTVADGVRFAREASSPEQAATLVAELLAALTAGRKDGALGTG